MKVFRYRRHCSWFVSLASAQILIVFFAASAESDVVIDGVYDAQYGRAIAVQTVETGFGDNLSEWNAVYGNVSNGRLNVLITGNLEANFNKLEIFIDSRAGGENTLSGAPGYDFFDADGNQDWISSRMVGMTFDTPFTADYHLYARAGFGNLEFDFIDRLGGAGTAVNGNFGATSYAGGIGDSAIGEILPGDLANGQTVGNALSSSITFAMDNSNVAGIGGNAGAPADQAAALAVMTGFEFSIELSELNLDSNHIRLAIMQAGGNHDYLSNQVLGGLPVGMGNLGGDGMGNYIGDLSGIDFNNYAGQQFITISTIPEPGSSALMLLAGVTMLVRRRHACSSTQTVT